jgi:succinyl-CoA:acetate CoA-transferase
MMVESEIVCSGRGVKGADDECRRTTQHILVFLTEEGKHGRLPENVDVLQPVACNIGNVVIDTPVPGLAVYMEIAREVLLPIVDCGNLGSVVDRDDALKVGQIPGRLRLLQKHGLAQAGEDLQRQK